MSRHRTAASCATGLLLLTLALLRTDVVRAWDVWLQVRVPVKAGRGAAGLAVAGAVLLGQRGLVGPLAAVTASLVSWRARRARPLLVLLGALLLLAASTDLLKLLIGRLAPASGADLFGVGGRSYPSGHTAGALVSYGVLALVLTGGDGVVPGRLRGRLIAVACLLAATTGAGVVLKGYHWASDAVGGYLLGAVFLALASPLVPAAPERRAGRDRAAATLQRPAG